MAITLSELKSLGTLEKVAIRSMDRSLYKAEIMLDGRRQTIANDEGEPLRSHNLADMKRHLLALDIARLVLVQDSAYDEMIGQPEREGSNAMELPVGPDEQPLPPWLN